jgi:hypothetical protein
MIVEQMLKKCTNTAFAKPVLPAVRSFEYWTKKELEALPAREFDN